MSDKMLNTIEAAEYLGMQPCTLEAWRVRGGGPKFVKFSKRAVRYPVSYLEEFVVERVQTSTSLGVVR